MKMYDMKSETVVAHGLLATLSGTTPAAGNIVDTIHYCAATFALITGTVTDAGTVDGIVFEVQESDTTAAADFTAVADVDLLGLESDVSVLLDTEDDIAKGVIGYRGTKRYVRVVATGTTSTDATVAGVWVLQKPRYAPPASHAAANIAAT